MSDKREQLIADLEKNYKDFFHFSLELIRQIDNNNNYLKFAVVNMQISLELFLKYYFLKKDKDEWLFSKPDKFVFKDFSVILNAFFAEPNFLITRKKYLHNILEARNKIVHEGRTAWNEELADNLINTTLFIQNVLNREFQETLMESWDDAFKDLELNTIWKNGTENFAKNIAKLNNAKVYECWFCYSDSFLDKKLFSYDEFEDEGFQCITCLNSLYLHHQIGVAECTCGDKTFVVDCLNPEDKKYDGKCLNCHMKYFAFHCDHCEKYFLDFDDERLEIENSIFCCEECKSNHQKN